MEDKKFMKKNRDKIIDYYEITNDSIKQGNFQMKVLCNTDPLPNCILPLICIIGISCRWKIR